MCIRDSLNTGLLDGRLRFAGSRQLGHGEQHPLWCDVLLAGCLLYTSDAADERSSVDLGGRRILKKKNNMRPRRTAICIHIQLRRLITMTADGYSR